MRLSSFVFDEVLAVTRELRIKDSYGIFPPWQSLSPTEKSLLEEISLVKGTLFNLEKLPFDDVLNRQKHFYPTSPPLPELLAQGRICKNAKWRQKEIKHRKPCIKRTGDPKCKNAKWAQKEIKRCIKRAGDQNQGNNGCRVQNGN